MAAGMIRRLVIRPEATTTGYWGRSTKGRVAGLRDLDLRWSWIYQVVGSLPCARSSEAHKTPFRPLVHRHPLPRAE